MNATDVQATNTDYKSDWFNNNVVPGTCRTWSNRVLRHLNGRKSRNCVKLASASPTQNDCLKNCNGRIAARCDDLVVSS